jgi:hypothetical protein
MDWLLFECLLRNENEIEGETWRIRKKPIGIEDKDGKWSCDVYDMRLASIEWKASSMHLVCEFNTQQLPLSEIKLASEATSSIHSPLFVASIAFFARFKFKFNGRSLNSLSLKHQNQYNLGRHFQSSSQLRNSIGNPEWTSKIGIVKIQKKIIIVINNESRSIESSSNTGISLIDLNCWECYAFIVHHGEKIQSIGQGNLQKCPSSSSTSIELWYNFRLGLRLLLLFSLFLFFRAGRSCLCWWYWLWWMVVEAVQWLK